jgi:hypothetical protein
VFVQLPDASGESSKLHLSDFSSLVSYSKELLLQRYAIKRLASKLSKVERTNCV